MDLCGDERIQLAGVHVVITVKDVFFKHFYEGRRKNEHDAKRDGILSNKQNIYI